MGKKEKTLIRVVLDTNILVSALLYKGELAMFHSLWKEKRILPLFSRCTFREFTRVLSYPKFELARDEIAFLLREEVLPYFEVVEIRKPIEGICEDPDDDVFISCAVYGKASYLVTGDAKLLAVSRYANVKMVRAAEFLRLTAKGS